MPIAPLYPVVKRLIEQLQANMTEKVWDALPVGLTDRDGDGWIVVAPLTGGRPLMTLADGYRSQIVLVAVSSYGATQPQALSIADRVCELVLTPGLLSMTDGSTFSVTNADLWLGGRGGIQQDGDEPNRRAFVATDRFELLVNAL